ncbi:MAG: hypothetical protein EBV65_02410, partial [Gammaproteobacteria bacterium]|nr:hypothetical protein [Gammaproteobacteria bacterium]
MNRAVKVFACAAMGGVALQLGLGAAIAANGLRTEIRRTAHGVPHVTASDYAGLGLGIGYASAEDNLCELMDRMLTVRGERAKYFGPGDKDANVVSDAYHRLVGYTGRVEALLAGPADSPSTPSKDARALLGGFVAGVNRYLRDTGVDKLPDARCRGADWVQPITELDYWRNLLIPGKLNVVGAGLMNTPLVGIGHTEHIAWTHTVSTARRFGYFELALDPADPTRYLVDGKSVAMLRIPIKIAVKSATGLKEIERLLHATQYGPVLATETFPWSSAKAYALAVPPQGLRIVDQYLAIWQARSVDDLRTALGRYQATQFNTTATDSRGRAFFGDMGMIPKVTTAHAERCATSPLARQQWTKLRIPVLDGSRSDCAWQTDADASAPGIFGPAAAPQLFRDDYVTQSNDSHWLSNPSQPLEGYSPIYGDERTPRTLRTLLGLDIVDRRLKGRDGLAGRGFDVDSLKASLFNNRHLGGEITRDDVVRSCIESTPGPMCDALQRWDLRVDL